MYFVCVKIYETQQKKPKKTKKTKTKHTKLIVPPTQFPSVSTTITSKGPTPSQTPSQTPTPTGCNLYTNTTHFVEKKKKWHPNEKHMQKKKCEGTQRNTQLSKKKKTQRFYFDKQVTTKLAETHTNTKQNRKKK